MEKNVIPVEAIRERDIDLILLEELTVNFKFREWFVNQLELPPCTEWMGVWRSITDFGLGETDILLSYDSDNRKVLVLVENKLDANFQDEQHGRYQRRARQYVDTGKCSEAFAVLVAPTQYCQNQNDFESYISYEEIGSYLESSGTARGVFKAQLFRIATEKMRRGYQPINSEPVQKFWKEYWVFKEKYYPELQMKEPEIVPHNSDWPMLTHPSLPTVKFRHKLGQGNVDATFKDVDENIKEEIKRTLPEMVILVEHSRTFSLRIYSGEVNRTQDFDHQQTLVDNGLKSIMNLVSFIIQKRKLLFQN